MAKENMKKNQYLVKKVSLMDTLRAIPLGESVCYDAPVAGTYGAACTAVSRLNKEGGELKIETEDNGASYIVTRLG